MGYPQIVYDAGSGPVTMAFTFPPVQKPGFEDGSADQQSAQRVDSITLSGKKQVFYFRTDIFRTLQMKNVPFEDLAAWTAFMNWALTGGQFTYYPDATLPASTDYTLEDTDWTPAYAFKGYASFKMIMRQLVV